MVSLVVVFFVGIERDQPKIHCKYPVSRICGSLDVARTLIIDQVPQDRIVRDRCVCLSSMFRDSLEFVVHYHRDVVHDILPLAKALVAARSACQKFQ